LWYILAEAGTSRYVIMMYYGNGDKLNTATATKTEKGHVTL